ncbi:MAG: hypothetical protein K2X39_09505, partial [Silvanigrellaceae bacterium]|nr:hypothetical protein [Silvanigrellaceae bacterium]
GLDNLPQRDTEFRKTLRLQAENLGWPHFHSELAKIDPLRAQQLHPNDKTRIERALEVYHLTGKPLSSLVTKNKILSEQPFLLPCFVIHTKSSDIDLKEQITTRIPKLFRQGWVKEVEILYEKFGNDLYSFQCLKALGYKEVLDFLLKKTSSNYDSLCSQISTLTWQYAKKQNTWNRKEFCHYAIDAKIFSEKHELTSLFNF